MKWIKITKYVTTYNMYILFYYTNNIFMTVCIIKLPNLKHLNFKVIFKITQYTDSPVYLF